MQIIKFTARNLVLSNSSWNRTAASHYMMKWLLGKWTTCWLYKVFKCSEFLVDELFGIRDVGHQIVMYCQKQSYFRCPSKYTLMLCQNVLYILLHFFICVNRLHSQVKQSKNGTHWGPKIRLIFISGSVPIADIKPQTWYASCSNFTWGRRQTLLECCSVSSHLILQLHSWKLYHVVTEWSFFSHEN